MKFLNNLIFLLLLPFVSFGAEGEKTPWAAFVTLAPYDLWLPNKMGATAVRFEQSRTYELAFQTASYNLDVVIDGLAGVSEQRIHLTTRSHTWDGSFNFQYGVYYNTINVHLGQEYLGLGAKSDVISVATAGGMWGFGNRWAWDNGFQLGADWFKIFYPFTTVKNESDFLDENASAEDKENVQELVDAFLKIPQLTLLHFEVGYRF